MPLVSICIPTYNSSRYLLKTIESLLNQSYQNLEVIVADDGSTDGTLDILSNINDPRLKYISLEKRGAAAARNEAFIQSNGSLVKFMDSDDLLSVNCIECQVSRIVNRPNCVASAQWGRFYKDDLSDFTLAKENVWKDFPGIDWLVESLIDTGANMMQPGIFLIPRPLIQKAGGWNERLSLIDDFDFMVRVIANSDFVLFCEEAVLKYRSGLQGSLSGKKTDKHLVSAFQSLNLGVDYILNVRKDNRSKLACANTLKRWSFEFYPQQKSLLHKMEARINDLGGSEIKILGGQKFQALVNLIGWKNAKKIELLVRKIK